MKQDINPRFVQDNQSSSIYGVIRGLHYQLILMLRQIDKSVCRGRYWMWLWTFGKVRQLLEKVFSIELIGRK